MAQILFKFDKNQKELLEKYTNKLKALVFFGIKVLNIEEKCRLK